MVGFERTHALMLSHLSADDAVEPSPDDLAAIDAEWPLIDAEMALVAAEIRVLTAPDDPTALDWRRLRRAEHRVAHEARLFSARSLPSRYAV